MKKLTRRKFLKGLAIGIPILGIGAKLLTPKEPDIRISEGLETVKSSPFNNEIDISDRVEVEWVSRSGKDLTHNGVIVPLTRQLPKG